MATADRIASRLDAALKAANVPIVGVSIGDPATRATWLVQPDTLQALAQPIIDAFNPDDASHLNAEVEIAAAMIVDSPLAKALLDVLADTFALKATPTIDRISSTDPSATIASARPAIDDLLVRLHGRVKQHLEPKE